MASSMRRGSTAGAQGALEKLRDLIRNFERELMSDELRTKVLALIPVFRGLRDLGRSLIPSEYASAARDRILYYLQKYPRTVIGGDELLVVSGIQEYARRVRELRVQFGWPIASGGTIREMTKEETDLPTEYKVMKPDQYLLLSEEQDRDAALRWNVANGIRRQGGAVQGRVLAFLRANVGRGVTGEELRYVSGDRTEWARRVRELRTEHGWPIATQSTGRPDLAVGIYLLQADRQSPEHDRDIPDDLRCDVLKRDDYRCTEPRCRWSVKEWNMADPRHLELHHIQHHAKGGGNSAENLRTLCNICHDKLHKREK